MTAPGEFSERRPAAARGSRGRLMLVGLHEDRGSLTTRLRHAPICVESVFEAIGELTAADLRRPIVAVLVPDSARPAPDSRVAEALKHIDPSVRVIRVRDCAAPAADRSSLLTDGEVDLPIDPALVARLAGIDLVDGVTGDERPLEARAPTPPPPTPPPTLAAPIAPAAPEPAPPIEPAATSPASPPEPAPAPPPIAARVTDALGDTDLLDAVMSDPEGVATSALRLMRQQSGWEDLVFVPAGDEEAAPIEGSVEVREGHQVHGRLGSATADAASLAPWAAWLARWLALDASYHDYRRMAYRDDLTGAWNRRYLQRFLHDVIAEAVRRRRPVTVMVFDIDDFKRYNDEFDHEAGDVILCETVALLESVIRSCDRVCRVGGDEFVVVFADMEDPREPGSSHPESVEIIARRFQEQISAMRFPKLGIEAPGRLSISAGLATYPWDGSDAQALVRLADQRAMESKRLGKNQLTFGPGTAAQDEDGPRR